MHLTHIMLENKKNLSFSIWFFLLVKSSPWSFFLLMQMIRPAPRTVRRPTRMPTVRFLLSAQRHTWNQSKSHRHRKVFEHLIV